MLSNVADAGLLSAAEEAGLFSKLEASGAFSKAEKLLPLGMHAASCRRSARPLFGGRESPPSSAAAEMPRRHLALRSALHLRHVCAADDLKLLSLAAGLLNTDSSALVIGAAALLGGGERPPQPRAPVQRHWPPYTAVHRL